MNNKSYARLSKFLSYILRHQPAAIGLTLDSSGWVDTAELIKQMNAHGKSIDLETLIAVVEENDKQRFRFNEDQSQIRANQGHSIAVTLNYAPKIPPAILYHGTAEKFLDSIFESGLEKRNRHHVHLSKDVVTARKVGQRHGKAVVLTVSAEKMSEAGFNFYESDNGVWLTASVPPLYLSIDVEENKLDIPSSK